MSITRTQMARQLMEMGGEALQAGAPDIQLEGNQIPQQEEMASEPNLDAELYQLYMEALKKGEVPQGTTFDMYKEIIMNLVSQKQDTMQPEMQEGIMQEGIMQGNEMDPEREAAAYGGIMGLDGRRQYGFGSFVRSFTRPIKKVVKKAVSAVKKVAKSDIGKAALAAAAMYYAPAMATRFGGANAPVGSFMNQLAGGNRLAAFKTLLPGGTTPGGGVSPLNFFSKTPSKIVTSNLGGTQSGISQAYTLADRAQDIDEKSAILNKAFSTVTGAAKNTSAPSNLLQTLTASRYAIPLLGGAAAGAATAMQPEQDIEAEIASVDRGDDFAKELQAIIDAKGGYKRFGLNPEFAQSAAEGGRIGYGDGGLTEYEVSRLGQLGYNTKGGTVIEPFGGLEVLRDILKVNNYAQGGRIGVNEGGIMMASAPSPKGDYDDIAKQLFGKGYKELTPKEIELMQEELERLKNKAAEGGLMSLGGNEMDLRGGGFVPLGAKEKADDVPARLSKNEFVFTADAVRAAGGGSVDKGADKMYRTMKRLEGVMV